MSGTGWKIRIAVLGGMTLIWGQGLAVGDLTEYKSNSSFARSMAPVLPKDEEPVIPIPQNVNPLPSGSPEQFVIHSIQSPAFDGQVGKATTTMLSPGVASEIAPHRTLGQLPEFPSVRTHASNSAVAFVAITFFLLFCIGVVLGGAAGGRFSQTS